MNAQNPAPRTTAIIIGAGFGGLSLAIRLQAMGVQVTVVEALEMAGGRARVREEGGHIFDMGPTVITVPHFIEELFALQPGDTSSLDAPDFPQEILAPDARKTSGNSGGPATQKYCTLTPILPFYRIYFDDGTYFDYDGDPESTRRQVEAICPADLAGYERFHTDARAIFERGFLELGYTCFLDLQTMLAVVPDLFKLDAVRNLFRFASKYFTSDKLRQVFSFETLLVGGSPLRVPAIYAMIHFVEKTWGIHYVMGGTGALVRGFVRKFEELGGTLLTHAPVAEILVDDGNGGPVSSFSRRVARGVRLEDGRVLHADRVVSNADVGHTFLKLLPAAARRWNPDLRVTSMRWSMSLVVIYFGFKDDPERPLDLRHHNIILGPRYEGLLTDIFDRKVLSPDFSQYLHVPSLTDPSMAPEGCHTAYTLIPVPHQGSGLDWSVEGPRLVEKVIGMLDDEGYIPNLRNRITVQSYIDPRYFAGDLRSHLGNAFGPEPVLTQSAWFRTHNRSQDVEGLYFVGAGAQPGGGTPSVMMSAKMTARCMQEDMRKTGVLEKAKHTV